MPIYTNDGGVSQLEEIYCNDGGVSRLEEIYCNDGGITYRLDAAYSEAVDEK